jgi:predicted glycosyltransferase
MKKGKAPHVPQVRVRSFGREPATTKSLTDLALCSAPGYNTLTEMLVVWDVVPLVPVTVTV